MREGWLLMPEKKRESSHLCRKVTRSPNEQTARGEAMRKTGRGYNLKKDSPVQSSRSLKPGKLESCQSIRRKEIFSRSGRERNLEKNIPQFEQTISELGNLLLMYRPIRQQILSGSSNECNANCFGWLKCLCFRLILPFYVPKS
jgi:hypothetical protein